ncbi:MULTISPECIES: dephospho-CoA kinase [Microbacterium]|uniref:dephospho-CoA kinase n=1 Tax=Microbacterium TaxID=33882 RepID=UPI000CCE8D54|nr:MULTISPECIES: dephospho-CoA kinase [Microbacterium]MDZ5146096.1 dephospho-CoA kinase [Microbacterium testaceum]PNW08822.1 dephospho-CoA kinase [Microbacterium testaceum]WJS92231.1 dephospho-CoA kinase [Microbacterium testaceum]
MPLLALTGGIASGKSTIAALLADRGAVVVDADAIVREVQAPGSPVLADIAAEFGTAVLRPDGSLDRPALGALVFGHPDRLARLNALVHPAVRSESQRRFSSAFAADPAAVVVYDVPLLAEARGGESWDLVVVAHCPADLRVRRLIDTRGLTEADARARIGSQASDEERIALADVVIDTSADMESTRRQVDELWERVMRAA